MRACVRAEFGRVGQGVTNATGTTLLVATVVPVAVLRIADAVYLLLK